MMKNAEIYALQNAGEGVVSFEKNLQTAEAKVLSIEPVSKE